MSDRTPKPETVRAVWCRAHPFWFSTDVKERGAEFDRMIAEVERAAAAKALEESADKFAAEDDPEWGHWQDYEGWSMDPSEPLRKLAAEYRREDA